MRLLDVPEDDLWEAWLSVLKTIAGDNYGLFTEAQWRECFEAGWSPVASYREALDAKTNPIYRPASET